MLRKNGYHGFWICFFFVRSFFPKISALTDTLTPSQNLSKNETLVSKDGRFELGFFRPGTSKNQYLGIWYRNIPVKTVVWVANRERPILDSPGMLAIEVTGNLVLRNRTDGVIWSSNSLKEAMNPIAQLLDSGNFVLRESFGDSGAYLWQSFDDPTDTLLPDMKVGWDFRTGLNRRVTSWKSPDDPSSGDLTWEIDLHGFPEGIVLKDSEKYFRSGPWNGIRFTGNPQLGPNPIFEYVFVSNQEELYYMYRLKNKSAVTRVVMNQTTSTRQRYIWMEDDQTWKLYAQTPQDYCDTYGLCGANGICIGNASPVCQCLEGFKPKLPEKWNAMDWKDGCMLSKHLNCQSIDDGFFKFTGVKWPDTTYSWWNTSMDLNECREKCLKNCSCTAYTSSNIKEGSGCALWFGDLVDIRQFPDEAQFLYVRMLVSSLEAKRGLRVFRMTVIVVAVGVAVAVFVMLSIGYWICMAKPNIADESGETETDRDIPSFHLAVIAMATEDFSIKRKLGEGGFGPVYKGTLPTGDEIAVKRLSQTSGQGLHEFQNEVALIAKLQHRNLVKLLGYCIEAEEKILIYEFMPNGSLGSFIFDQRRGTVLDWSKRFHIICGIARGLLYLHQDSRLRIIHRDLKASNILLDKELNPKISDFGLARTFGEQIHEESTKRVMGTYGYMAPEYAIYGIFSVKSDVFSFGIILLEIVTEKKNVSFRDANSQNLIGHVWKLWMEGRSEELIGTVISNSNLSEVLRCIQVGLLCVQSRADDRPDMLSVVLMLNGERALPNPKQPAFLLDIKANYEAYPSLTIPEFTSGNEITISLLEGR